MNKTFFEENGYVIIDNAFSINDIECFKECLDNLVDIAIYKAKIDHPDMHIPEYIKGLDQGFNLLNSIDQKYISFVQRTISRSAEFFKLCSSVTITQSIKQLLQMPDNIPLYLTSNGIVFTCPALNSNKDTDFIIDWHLDTFYTIPQSRFIQIWAPLYHDATEEIGTLIVCSGSNKKDPYQVRQKFNPELGYNNQYYISAEDVAEYEQHHIKLELGQLLIFDGRTIHRSGINNSNRVRCTMLGLGHDIRKEQLTPVTALYKYHGLTPEEHYFNLYQDNIAKKHIYDHAANHKPSGGV